MNKIRAVIIDDESHFIEVFSILLQEDENIEIIDTASSVVDGVKCIERNQPNVVFLDIEMPGQNGFDLIRQFDKPNFKVIFTTAYDQYAIKAIKFSALDYLLKPIDLTELNKAILKVNEQLNIEDLRIQNLTSQLLKESGLDKIMISANEGFRTLSLNDIVSIESKPGNYSIFCIKNGKQFICTKPLKYYDGLLPKYPFYRAHRSYIINLSYFTNYDYQSGRITLNQHNDFEVATRRRAELTTLLRSKFNY